jgi:hypothetical protein
MNDHIGLSHWALFAIMFCGAWLNGLNRMNYGSAGSLSRHGKGMEPLYPAWDTPTGEEK